jgi:transposase
MGRTSEYIKLRIYTYFTKSTKICDVVKNLEENEGIKINRNTVARWYKKFKDNGNSLTLADKKSSGRPSLVKKCHMDFIDQKLEENDELTAEG